MFNYFLILILIFGPIVVERIIFWMYVFLIVDGLSFLIRLIIVLMFLINLLLFIEILLISV